MIHHAKDASAMMSDDHQHHHHHQYGYIFRHPISYDNDCEDAMKILSVITIFNLALGYHLRGLRCGGGRSKAVSDEDLDKAVPLYELCYEILQVEDIDAGPFFLMAIANNIGMIYSVRGADDRAALFFEHLLSTQMFLVTGGDDSVATLDGYWCNTSRLVLSERSAPAA